MAETILVTGATGTVGSEFIKQLSRDRTIINIKAGVHLVENAKKVQQNDRLKAVQIDYNKPHTLRYALSDVDKIFFVTPVQSDMVDLSSNLLKEMDNTGNIKHIVKLSNMGEPQLTVVKLHRQIEKMIETPVRHLHSYVLIFLCKILSISICIQ